MKLVATPVTVQEKDVLKQARGKGGLVGKIMLMHTPLSLLRLEYKKYYRFAFPYSVMGKIFLFKRREFSSKIEILVDALTCKCAVNHSYSFALERTEGLHFFNGEHDLTVDEAHDIALKFAKNIVIRIAKSVPTFGETSEPEYFFRPHWVAYYGDSKDRNCRYLMYEADGHTFKR